MFQKNKYTECYMRIIEVAKTREISGYIEKHHIIPRCLFGRNDIDEIDNPDHASNIVSLTAREHFICHRLLTKMLKEDDPDRRKMFYAVSCFSRDKTGNRILSSHQYQKVKESLSIASTGRIVSDITKAKLSKAAQDFTQRSEWKENQRQAQKNRSKVSWETREKLSKALKDKPKSKEHALNISKGLKNHFVDSNSRLKRSIQSTETNSRPEVKEKIRKSLTGTKRSLETRQRNKEAAILRCSNSEYLEKQSQSQKIRWKNNPQKWWTNGESNARRSDSPGEGWYMGRTKKSS